MTFSKTARTYAESLYVFALDTKSPDAIARDAAQALEIIAGSADLKKMLENPLIKNSDKHAVLKSIFAAKFSAEFLRFVAFLAEKDRVDAFREILLAFTALRDEREGNLRVTVEAAAELTQEQKDRIKSGLETRYRKNIFLTEKVNADLLGGFILRVGDMIIDASMRNKLAELKKKFSSV